MSKNVGVELEENEIDEAFVFKNKNSANKKQVMFVKFDSKKAKDKLMSVKSKLKENYETKNIFINDYSSKETLNLLKYAKTLKNVGYLSVYTYSGKVYVKRSATSKPKLIKMEDDVDTLLLEATTNSTRRRSNVKPTATREDTDDDDNRSSFLFPDYSYN